MKKFILLAALFASQMAMGAVGTLTLNGDNVAGIRNVKNFTKNGAGELNAIGPVCYADTAGTEPVDGTGGSPVLTMTRVANSTPPSMGDKYHWVITKDAANRQGNGCGIPFQIDGSAKAKVLSITFDTQVVSGTFVPGDNSTSSDITIWIYDVTNAKVIQPTSFKILSNSTALSNKFIANFQTAADSTSYRLLFHQGTTSAAAYAIGVDDIIVSPAAYTSGTIITDWKSETIALSALITKDGGNTITFNTPTMPLTFVWRRVGSNAEISAHYMTGQPGQSASTGGTYYLLNIPAVIGTIDTAVTGTGSNWSQNSVSDGLRSKKVGDITQQDNNGGSRQFADGALYVVNSTQLLGFAGTGLNSGVSAGAFPWGTGSSTFGDLAANITQAFTFNINVPIAGWKVQSQTSDQNDQRAVVWTGRGTTQQLLGAYGTPITMDIIDKDTHKGWDASTKAYTIQVPGDYLVMFSAWDDGGGTTNWNVYKNQSLAGGGTPLAGLGFSTNYNLGSGAFVVADLKVGDVLHFGETSGSQYVSAYRSASITKIGTGPQQISATEAVSAIVTGTPATASANAIIIWPTVQKDTHNAYNASTGQYKIPISGFYDVDATLSASVGNNLMSVYVNGTIRQTMGIGVAASGFATGKTKIYCLAGDLVDVRIAGGTGTTSGTSTFTIGKSGI